MVSNKLDIPFNLKLDYGLSSKVFDDCIVVMGLENKGGGIKALSSSLTFPLEIVFSLSKSIIEDFKASPVASWNSMSLEGGTP
jgi:hypothetical protein